MIRIYKTEDEYNKAPSGKYAWYDCEYYQEIRVKKNKSIWDITEFDDGTVNYDKNL